jgi:hypothetical protein
VRRVKSKQVETVDPDQGWTLLAEVAAATGSGDEKNLLPTLDGEARKDWAGRWVIRTSLAREFVESAREQRERRARMRAEHADYLAECGRRRSEFMQSLFASAYEAARQLSEKQSRSSGWRMDDRSHRIASQSPATRAAARDAMAELLTEFDRDNPVLPLDQYEARGGSVAPPSPNTEKAAKEAARIARDKLLEMMRARAI